VPPPERYQEQARRLVVEATGAQVPAGTLVEQLARPRPQLPAGAGSALEPRHVGGVEALGPVHG
jgi:hypothetical protein